MHDARESAVRRPVALRLSTIPKLLVTYEELMDHDLSPNEARVVARVNGVRSVEAIIREYPPELDDALAALAKLRDDGVITL